MEEGWSSVGGSVCAKCFTDYSIQNFIKTTATECECSYCGKKTKKKLIAAEVDEVLSFISAGFAREYDIPENCLPYDSSEGGWQLVEPEDSYDIFCNLDICSETSGNLCKDLRNAFSNRMFVPRDPLVLSRADGLKYSWKTFCEHTKHETRFVFFRVKPRRRPKSQAWHPDDEWSGYSPPYQILLGLGEMVKAYRLIKLIPRGTRMIRARQHEATVSCANANDLGSPPKHKASQSRMSPAGIPMFYGAGDESTAFVEIVDVHATAKDTVTFGTFTSTRPLRLLNLTNLPDIPSIFDELNYDSRPPLIFLHHFQRDISEPVQRDGREHYEYVPTQIVAEYFRHVYREGRKRVDGIMFNSSHKGAGICYCIFAGPDACTDGPKPQADDRLLLLSHRRAQIDFATKSFT